MRAFYDGAVVEYPLIADLYVVEQDWLLGSQTRQARAHEHHVEDTRKTVYGQRLAAKVDDSLPEFNKSLCVSHFCKIGMKLTGDAGRIQRLSKDGHPPHGIIPESKCDRRIRRVFGTKHLSRVGSSSVRTYAC